MPLPYQLWMDYYYNNMYFTLQKIFWLKIFNSYLLPMNSATESGYKLGFNRLSVDTCKFIFWINKFANKLRNEKSGETTRDYM